MKLLSFSPEEQRLVRLVAIASVAACLAIVAGAWGFRWLRLRQPAPASLKNSTLSTDPADFFARNKELLPIDIVAHRLAAEHYAKTGQHGRAIQHLLRALSEDEKDRGTRLELATVYLHAGVLEEALAEFAELDDEEASDSIAEHASARRGLVHYYLGQYGESIDRLDRCLERFPNSFEAACYRGQVEASENLNSPNVLPYFERALSLNPSYPEALYQRARYFMNKPGAKQGEYAQARADLQALLAVEPLNVKAHSRLGMVYYYLGQFDLAANSYRTALALNPIDFRTHYNLGELYYSAYGDSTNALREFLKALAIDSMHVEGNFRAGLISLANGAPNEAIVHLDRARRGAEVGGDIDLHIRILFQLGVAWEANGMRDRARSAYERVVRLDPLNAVAHQKLALLGGRP